MEVSFEERCPEEEVPLYEKGVPFVNKKYTKGVPSLLKMVYKRVRGWTSPDVEPLRRKRFWVKCKGPWKGEKWEGSNVLPVLQRLAHLWGLGTRHSYDRDGNKNVPKSDWFSKQNNNCSRAPRARFFFAPCCFRDKRFTLNKSFIDQTCSIELRYWPCCCCCFFVCLFLIGHDFVSVSLSPLAPSTTTNTSNKTTTLFIIAAERFPNWNNIL